MDWILNIVSRSSVITDLTSVAEVLKKYLTPVAFVISVEPDFKASPSLCLTIDYKAENLFGWPSAIERQVFINQCADDLPDAFHDGKQLSNAERDEFVNTLFEAYAMDGDAGFIKMLSELAAYISTPLHIQALLIEDTGLPMKATEWYVRPGETDVEVTQFRQLYDGWLSKEECQ
jgi:hypothetical protein